MAGPLTRTDHNGEEVTYIDSEGTEYVVNAVVDRHDLVADEQVSQVARLLATVVLPKTGLPATVNNGGDKVRLAMKLGGAVKDARVREIISQDEGAWTVSVSA